jgi:hypothetical protein
MWPNVSRLVAVYDDDKPKRRLFELLRSQGMQANQQIEFLSDGGRRSATSNATLALKRSICWTGFT